MPAGHISALPQHKGAPYGVLEVDENYLPEVLDTTGASVVCLLNLSRDQLDRADEIWLLAQKWRRALAGKPTHVIANADDPLVTWGASTAAKVTWVAAGQRWKDDSWGCPECGGAARAQGRRLGLPRVHLPPARAAVDRSTTTRSSTRAAQRWLLDLQLPGRANRSNAAMALAVAAAFGAAGRPGAAQAARGHLGRRPLRQVERDGRQRRGCCWPRTRPAGWRRSTWPTPACRSSCRSTPGAPTAATPPGCGTSTTASCAAGRVRHRRPPARPGGAARGRRRAVRALRRVRRGAGQQPPGRVEVIANYTAFQDIRAEFGRAV